MEHSISRVVPLLAAASLALTACAHTPAAPKAAEPPPKIEIAPRDADALLRKGAAILVDVREKAEVDAGMAAPAMWFPISAAEAKDGAGKVALDRFAAGLPKDMTIVVYCKSGRRAARFAAYMKERGFAALNMGAFDAWKAAGLPVKTAAN